MSTFVGYNKVFADGRVREGRAWSASRKIHDLPTKSKSAEGVSAGKWKECRGMSSKDKFGVVLETAGLNEAELADVKFAVTFCNVLDRLPTIIKALNRVEQHAEGRSGPS